MIYIKDLLDLTSKRSACSDQSQIRLVSQNWRSASSAALLSSEASTSSVPWQTPTQDRFSKHIPW